MFFKLSKKTLVLLESQHTMKHLYNKEFPGNTTSNNSQQIFMETSTMEFHQPDSLQIGVENNSFMGNLSQYEISQQGVSGNKLQTTRNKKFLWICLV
ncbi:hypothetical protein Avbf_01709, partial [Armadillidium vulgare]